MALKSKNILQTAMEHVSPVVDKRFYDRSLAVCIDLQFALQIIDCGKSDLVVPIDFEVCSEGVANTVQFHLAEAVQEPAGLADGRACGVGEQHLFRVIVNIAQSRFAEGDSQLVVKEDVPLFVGGDGELYP